MRSLQTRPEQSPLRLPDWEPEAFLALHRAQAMGLVTVEGSLAERLGRLLDAALEHKIGVRYAAELMESLRAPGEDPSRQRRLLLALWEALGENPVPREEARVLAQLLGEERLAHLLQISRSSAQRYARGERQVPEAIVDKLHWLAILVGHLTGTYNELGVRRWLERPRTALGGRSPTEALLADGAWTPESDGARSVDRLARATIGMAAT